MRNNRDIHGQVDWPATLARLGVPKSVLSGKHGPCPGCGGRDRFRFTNYRDEGRYVCNQCGNGDGFDLLRLVHGWDFKTALAEVRSYNRIEEEAPPKPKQESEKPAQMPRSARQIMNTSTQLEAVPDAVEYLTARNLWPLRTKPRLRGHAGVDYWDPGGYSDQPEKIGRWPAIVAPVEDINGDPVTVHLTYLENGWKLQKNGHPDRKLKSPVRGRKGCAVRLWPLPGDETGWDGTLGITEGIETALAAQRIYGGVVWATLNTSLMANFTPPDEVGRLIVYADRDVGGLIATIRLMERLEIPVEAKIPQKGDWADALAK